MKIKNLIGVVLTVIAITGNVLAQDGPPNPCPDCPPCTNCPPPAPYVIPEYPLDAVLVRVARIQTPGWVQVYTNYGWQIDSNNLLISAGASAPDTSVASQWQTLVYMIAVTNTLPSRVYSIQYSTNVAGPWWDLGSVFYGTTNDSEYVVESPMPNVISIPLFWRAKQQDGFVLYAQAATNGFNGGNPGGCPGTYHGYINFVRYATNGWGYRPNTNVLDHWATDLVEPTNHLEMGTDYGLFDCNTNTVKWTNIPTLNPPLYGTAARFTIFFLKYPTNQAYPIWVRGYIEPTNAFSIPSPRLVGSTRSTKKQVEVQPFVELDEIQQKAFGITHLMTQP